MTKRAWGEVEMSYAPINEQETMPDTLTSIGEIKEDSLGLETEDGTVLQVFKEGHILVDELQLEPTLKVNLTLTNIPESIRTVFWDAEKTGTGDNTEFGVKSLINSEKFAIEFAAIKVPGSDTFRAPKCSISMSPLYSSKEGWTANIKITLIRGLSGKLFTFGKVPQKAKPNPETE